MSEDLRPSGDVTSNLIKNNKKIKNYNYFIKSFYEPNLPFKFGKQINLFANSSIDISDGLFQDLNHLTKNSKLAYLLNMEKIPISFELENYLFKNKLNKKLFISKGDDYQILFTASKNKRNLIRRIAHKTSTLVTRIGVIQRKNHKFSYKKQGYIHRF